MPNRFKKNGMHASTSPPVSERILPQGTMEKPRLSLWPSKGEGVENAMKFILDNPGLCLGTAFVVGVLFGWLLKRK